MQQMRAPLPVGEIYQEASITYLRAFGAFARVAGVAALAVNGFLFYNFVFYAPSPWPIKLAWAILVSFFTCAFVASTAILPMILELREQGTASATAALAGLRQHAGRVIIPAAPIAIFLGLIIPTWIGIVLACFLLVKLGLSTTAVIVEDNDVTDSYARSWELVRNKWGRTAGIMLGAMAPFAMLAALAAIAGFSPVATFVLLTIAEALVIPFFVAVLLALFEDYRSIIDEEPAATGQIPPRMGH